jgi:hypothetical protein
MCRLNKLVVMFSVFLALSSCGTVNKSIPSDSDSIYKAWNDPNDEFHYEGNIVVETFDLGGEPLYGTKIEIFSGGKLISQMVLDETYTGVFSKDVKTIIVRVSKAGFQEVKTAEIELDENLACFINFNLAINQ